MKSIRPITSPNQAFKQQLALYFEMGWPDNVEDHPKYQRWAFRQHVEASNAIGRAPDEIRFVDHEREVAQVAGLVESAEEKAEVELRCKRCR